MKHRFNYDEDRHDFGDGTYAVARTKHDESMGEPWKEHDGHGIVSDWTNREKKPGERVLSSGIGNRYYDFAATMRLAKRDGWGLSPDDVAKLAVRLGRQPTAGDITAEAVERDFERLRGWCNDEWHWLGVIVELRSTEDDHLISRDSLWGIESDGDYWKEVAEELADSLHEQYLKEQAERQHWAERDTITKE